MYWVLCACERCVCVYVTTCVPMLLCVCVPRAMTEDMLKKAREDQVMHKEHFLAVQAQRDRAQFEKILK